MFIYVRTSGNARVRRKQALPPSHDGLGGRDTKPQVGSAKAGSPAARPVRSLLRRHYRSYRPAWLLATCSDAPLRDGVQAVKYAEQACKLTHYGVTPFIGTLAAAYAEAGRYDDAIVAAQQACALATAAGEPALLEQNRKLLALYRAHQPYHETVGKPVSAVP